MQGVRITWLFEVTCTVTRGFIMSRSSFWPLSLHKPLCTPRFSPSWAGRPRLPKEALCAGGDVGGSEEVTPRHGWVLSHAPTGPAHLAYLAHLLLAYEQQRWYPDRPASYGHMGRFLDTFQPILNSGQKSGTGPEKSLFSSRSWV